MAGIRIEGNTSGNVAEVAGTNQLKVIPETNAFDNPANVGGVKNYSENDDGVVSGVPQLFAPEVDLDYRMRMAPDWLVDNETFNYTAQNTGKHTYANTTMTNTWAVGALTTNGTNITTTTTGTSFGTYAEFPLLGTATLAYDIEASFSAQPVTNTTIDFGAYRRGAANPYAPTDGAYFRLTSAGLQGVVNYNGTETTTSVFAFTYTNNKKYQFILYINQRQVEWWINDGVSVRIYGSLQTPTGNGQPFASATMPLSVRHAIVGGAAGSVINFQLSCYSVRVGGPNIDRTAGIMGNAMFGAYQGLSGGTMGSLANYANSANPTAAVPTNTTAALGSGLGGQFWETATLALNTDGIICSFQVPAGTASVQGRRLAIRGISLWSYIQTVITGGPFVCQWSLAFGHTAVSLATAEAATTKAPRRLALPFDQVVTAAQAVSTKVAQSNMDIDFGDAPVFVNPGEFVALVTKHVGTVGTAGVIAHMVTFVYTWE